MGNTPCRLTADIECTTFSGRSCIDISPPTDLFCNSQFGVPLSVDFQYTGSGLLPAPSQVRIVAVGGTQNDVLVFDGTVSAGEGLRFGTGLNEEITITISDVNENQLDQ